MGQNPAPKMHLGGHSADLRVRWGPLRRVNMVQNGHMASPGTALRGLVRVSGGPERMHGVLKFEILSFLQPLWCDLHVFQGST